MALLVDESSPVNPIKEAPSFKGSSPSPDRRFWSTLRGRVDALVENRRCGDNLGGSDRRKRLKEDSLLLLRGFDSVADTLSQLHHNIDYALQGARDLAQPPTLIELFHHKMQKREADREDNSEKRDIPETEEKEKEEEEGSKELKRKFEDTHGSSEDGKLGKAKKLASSMAIKAYSLSRELKSLRSDLWFMQDRCALLEEDNRRLRNGLAKGIQPEEDDLVRLQLEALLAEKSKLANENANLMRENACLNQLVEYHQITSRQLHSPTSFYEQTVRSLDFSSPPRSPPPHAEENKAPVTPSTDTVGYSTTPLDDEWHSAEQLL